MPFKFIYNQPNKIILGRISPVLHKIVFLSAGIIFGGYGIGFLGFGLLGFNYESFSIGLVCGIAGILGFSAFFNLNKNTKKYIPEFISFDNESGLIKIESYNRSVIYIPYSQIADFKIIKRGIKNPTYHAYLVRGDKSKWELFSGTEKGAEKFIEELLTNLDTSVPSQTPPPAFLPNFIKVFTEGNVKIITWKNTGGAVLGALALMGAFVISFFNVFILKFIESPGDTWPPLLIIGFIFTCFCIVTVSKVYHFLKDRKLYYGLRIGENFIEYFEKTDTERLVKSQRFDFNEFHKLSTSFDSSNQEIGSVFLTRELWKERNIYADTRKFVFLRFNQAGFFDALAIETWVDEQVKQNKES